MDKTKYHSRPKGVRGLVGRLASALANHPATVAVTAAAAGAAVASLATGTGAPAAGNALSYTQVAIDQGSVIGERLVSMLRAGCGSAAVGLGASLTATKVATVAESALAAMRQRLGSWLQSCGLRPPTTPSKDTILEAMGQARDAAQARGVAAAKRYGALTENAPSEARAVRHAALRIALGSDILREEATKTLRHIGLTDRQAGGYVGQVERLVNAETRRFVNSLPKASAERFDATVERTLAEMRRERAGTPALPSPSDPVHGVSLAGADPARYLDKATTVLAGAAAKAMETTISVDRDPHVDPAARLAADTAGLDAIASALPGYAAEDRMRLVEAVEARRVEIEGQFTLLSPSERDYAASLSSFAAEPLENTTAQRLHDALLGRDAAFRVQMADRLDGVVAGLDRLTPDATASKALHAGLTALRHGLMVLSGQSFNADATAPLIAPCRRDRAQIALNTLAQVIASAPLDERDRSDRLLRLDSFATATGLSLDRSIGKEPTDIDRMRLARLYDSLITEGADRQRFMAAIGVDGSGTTGYKVVAKAFDAVAILDSVRAMSARAANAGGEVAQRLGEVIDRSGLADALKEASVTKHAANHTDVWHYAR